MGLDKFYTLREAAKTCFEFLSKTVNLSDQVVFLEPSAGAGAFLEFLPCYVALDIAPEAETVEKQDFLKYQTEKRDFVTIGNPPFGSRSKLAIDFFNKAAEISEAIAFIVPVSFMKWNVQKNLNNNFSLADFMYLAPESFTDKGKPYSVRTVFQVWVKKGSRYDNGVDLRLKKQPPISHPDFNIWQYNATPEAVKFIDENWEIATYRQGRYDFNKIFTREDYDSIKEQMTGERKKQFFFIQPLSEEARKIILSMDFNALAERNTLTPGFGKGDFVSYYMELKNQ